MTPIPTQTHQDTPPTLPGTVEGGLGAAFTTTLYGVKPVLTPNTSVTATSTWNVPLPFGRHVKVEALTPTQPVGNAE